MNTDYQVGDIVETNDCLVGTIVRIDQEAINAGRKPWHQVQYPAGICYANGTPANIESSRYDPSRLRLVKRAVAVEVAAATQPKSFECTCERDDVELLGHLRNCPMSHDPGVCSNCLTTIGENYHTCPVCQHPLTAETDEERCARLGVCVDCESALVNGECREPGCFFQTFSPETPGCGATGPNGFICTNHNDTEHVARGIEFDSFAEAWPLSQLTADEATIVAQFIAYSSDEGWTVDATSVLMDRCPHPSFTYAGTMGNVCDICGAMENA